MIEDEEVKSFFEYLVSKKAESDYTKNLENYVNDAKNNMEYKRQFMEWERQMARQFADGKKEGLAEGAQEKAVNDAVLLVKKYKATPESAASDMEAPLELVLERLKG